MEKLPVGLMRRRTVIVIAIVMELWTGAAMEVIFISVTLGMAMKALTGDTTVFMIVEVSYDLHFTFL